jgi:intracellular multiplication protein IcmV
MKKKLGSRIVNLFSRIIKVREWFDWARVKAITLALKDAIKSLFVLQKKTKSESESQNKPQQEFEAAVSEMKLTETDLSIKQKSLLRLALLMLSVALLIFIYGAYHLFNGSYKAAIVSLAIMMIALGLAFRYHFWYFQIKHRQLGCTFNQWYRQGLLGEKK